MSVAQTKAARRRFREYYKKGVIGRPYYKRKSVSSQERREAEFRAKRKAEQNRRKK